MPAVRITLTILVVALTGCATGSIPSFRSCHFGVELPAGWTVTESGTECRFYLNPDARGDSVAFGQPAVVIDVHHVGLEEAMTLAGVERREDGAWVHYGRAPSFAEPCSTRYASGQCVTMLHGVFREGKPGYQGLGETELVVLSNGEYSALVITNEGSFDATSILQSFRFR